MTYNPMASAIKEMASTLGDCMTAGDTGSHFTCTEADSIARVLVRGGEREAAITWLEGHADGDEFTDSHLIGGDDENKGRVMTRDELGDYVDSLN